MSRRYDPHRARAEIREGTIRDLGAVFRKFSHLFHTAKAENKFDGWGKGRLVADLTFASGFDDLIDQLTGSINADLTIRELLFLAPECFQLERDINRLLNTLSTSRDDIDALIGVIRNVYSISRFMGEHPVKKSIKGAKGGAGNAADWHKIALVRAAALRKKHPDNTKPYTDRWIANRVYVELKDKPDGPPSLDAVYKHLRRNLWTHGVRPTK
jgi:hypothetical protein